jgi:hypothetical protein
MNIAHSTERVLWLACGRRSALPAKGFRPTPSRLKKACTARLMPPAKCAKHALRDGVCSESGCLGHSWPGTQGGNPRSAIAHQSMWGHSSAGRALEWHSRGRRFDPAWLHQPLGSNARLSGWSDFSRYPRGLAAPSGIGVLARRCYARSGPPPGRPFSTPEVECPSHDARDWFELRRERFDLSAGVGSGHERRRGLVGPVSLRSP